MSDYPMLISNKLHSFRNFYVTKKHIIFKLKSSRTNFLPFFFGSVAEKSHICNRELTKR